MRKSLFFAFLLLAAEAMAQKTISVTVSNNSKIDKTNEPVVISLASVGFDVKSALVKLEGAETPCQLDDIDRDGRFDELCFMTDIAKKTSRTFSVTLYDKGTPRQYTPKVYAELMLRNGKIKAKNKHDIYLSELTVNRGVNPYSTVHHHGVAFENELLCMRVYFDHRQTVDLYGKYHKRLELKETQFYPDEEQKQAGYGDDILWAGNSYGLGALRGWDGNSQTMLNDVEQRSQRIIANGPLRTIVEIEDKGWTPQKGVEPLDMKTHYILYAGRRDCFVKAMFNRSVSDCLFATGFVNVGGNATEYTDRQGLRGCWGTAWPVALKDTVGHKRETVGLGIYIPKKNILNEKKATIEEFTYVVGTKDQTLNYRIAYSSDNEDFGFHNANSWFRFLRMWKDDCEQPITIKVQY